MPQKVRVILLENIAGLGSAGDTVTVSEGYARNYLFPHSQAALATAASENITHQRQAKASADAAAKLEAAEQLAEQLDHAELTLTARVKENNDIFGKITAATIAKELSQQTSHTFKPKDILLAEPITKLGEYDITVSVGENVEANFHLTVKPE